MSSIANGRLCLPLAWLYGGLVRLRNRLYDRPATVRRAAIPVVSVGNLTVGGTGKTPIVAWLAAQLRTMHRRPAIVSRGYGGNAGRGPLVVSKGTGPLCGPERCGDEPFLLASSLRGVPVVVGADRWAGAEAARQQGADLVILDDGFQHRRLARDLDVVLIDARKPLGEERLLPAGRLREPLSALGRADVVLITRADPHERYPRLERLVREQAPAAPLLFAGHRTVGFFDTQDRPAQAPARAVAFCGIGSPEPFRDDLRAEAVDVVEFRVYRDHHVYTHDELAELQRQSRAHEAALVTTEKDLARLRRRSAASALPRELLVLRIEAVVYRPEPLLEVLRRLHGRAA